MYLYVKKINIQNGLNSHFSISYSLPLVRGINGKKFPLLFYSAVKSAVEVAKKHREEVALLY